MKHKKLFSVFLAGIMLFSHVFEVNVVAYNSEKTDREDVSRLYMVTEDVPNTNDEVEVEEKEEDIIEINWDLAEGEEYVQTYYDKDSVNYFYADYSYYVCVSEDKELSITSSDTSVIKVKEESNYTFYKDWEMEGNRSVDLEVCGVGVATLTIAVGDVSKTVDVYVLPGNINITKISQTKYRHATVKWEKNSKCSGYIVQRAAAGTDEYTNIVDVKGGNKSSVEVEATWGKEYNYRVVGYIKKGNENLIGKSYGKTMDFCTKKPVAKLKSVKKKGASSLKIMWEKMEDAKFYKIYRSTSENGKYTCIYTTKKVTTTSYTQKVSTGKAYYYYVEAVYPKGKSAKSNSISGYIPKKVSEKKIVQGNVTPSNLRVGQYAYYNWANPDSTYYYTSGKKMYMVMQQNKSLNVYQMDSKLNATLKKTIDLGEFEKWGGFYHGIDGCFYVAVGYNNLQENDKKTVIKVYKYDKNWNKKKTCNIKGSATNAFKGIYEPFRGGSCRMDMIGNVLYVYTARTMYVHDDGLHHQSNIAFRINTKNMTYKDATENYTSHSFNQYIKFKDGALYQVDHGDAYPRSICLSITKNYGKDTQSTLEKNIFSIHGNIGDNYTGVTVGGMEVGKDNVVVCGTAQPHDFKIQGVSGFEKDYIQNVYVLLANKDTGKRTVRWLTNLHPKKSTTTVSETRMVKISDTRFAVMFSTKNQGNTELNCVIIDDKGKIIQKKVYKDMKFNGSSQPFLYNGAIYYTESDYEWGRAVTTTYQVPVVY